MSDQPIQLALHSRHEAAGARFSPFAGFAMPLQYTSIVEEHHAVRQRAGLFDVSHMGELRVRGKDAVTAVNGLVSQCLRRIDVGQAVYTVMCHEHGGIVDDLVVYKLAEDDILICMNASNRAKDYDYAKAHLKGDVTLENESEAWAQLALQGPTAERILQNITQTPLEQVRYYRATFAEVGGQEGVLVSRTGYTGEDGFELYIPTESAPAVFDAIVEAGGDELALCGLGCRDTLRLESKLALYGNDIDDTTNPLEAGLAWVVKLDKPEDFPGRSAIETIKKEGVTRRLRALKLNDKGVLRAGYPILVDGVEVGQLTSGAFSPTLGAGIGMGYVAKEHAGKDLVDVQVRKRTLGAALSKRAFYSRSK